MTTDAQIVLDAERARLRAFSAADIETLDRLLADELTYTHSNGAIEGKAPFIDRLARGQVRFSDDEVIEADLRIYGDIALYNGRFRLVVETADKQTRLDSRQLSVWRRNQNGQWQQIATASSPIPASSLIVSS